MSKIILRFDDLSEYSLCNIWDKIEDILVEYKLKPIVAIVPENLDVKISKTGLLIEQVPRTDFWMRVRKWQSEYGWEIAAHGLNHTLAKTLDNIMWFSQLSEYAELSFDEKKSSIKQTLEIFKNEDVQIRTWVAPAHGFDHEILKILKNFNFEYISDGFYFSPVLDRLSGLVFVPQQAWKLRTWYPFRVSTVCMHHLSWTNEDINKFEGFVVANKKKFISLEQSLALCQQLDIKHNAINFLFNLMLVLKKKLI